MKFEIPIQIHGIDLAIEAIENFFLKYEFKKDVSEEYKRGSLEFSNALIKALKEMRNDNS